MEIMTKHFGLMDYDEKDIVHFPEGLFGFEDTKDYVPIALMEDDDSVLFLQSVSEEQLAFIIMNPFTFPINYLPKISPEDISALENPKEDEISYYVICVPRENPAESTVNLKCPIAVNAITRSARQILLTQNEYSLRHCLKELMPGEKER